MCPTAIKVLSFPALKPFKLCWEKGFCYLCFLDRQKHGVERSYTLFHIVSHYLVESESGRLVELLEKVSHEVLQQAVFVVEL